MNLQNDIREITLGFFDAVNADVSDAGGVYRIKIPEAYRSTFRAQDLSITFDRDISSKHNCDLVAPGSQILSAIIEICSNKGPVVVKGSATDGTRHTIRYHFFISLSGKSSVFMTDQVDVDLEPNPDPAAFDHFNDNTHPLGRIEPRQVTITYTAALKILKERYAGTVCGFMNDANKRFEEDVKQLTDKHDSHARELDGAIRRRDAGSADPDRAAEFRFRTVDMIKELENEKRHLIKMTQKRHRVVISYRLVACEILPS